MPVNLIQPSFAGGELAPELSSRIDIQRWGISLKTLRNMIVHRFGTASNRPGTQYVAKTKYADKKETFIPFEFSRTQRYALETGHQYIRFCMDGGQVQSGGVPYEIATPYEENDLPLLKYAQSADVMYIVHPLHAPRTLTRYGHTDWEIDYFPYKNGPFMQTNGDSALTLTPSGLTGDINLTANFDIFDPLHVGALFKITHYMEGQTVSGSFTAIGTSTNLKLKEGKTWRLITHGVWTGKFRIEQSLDGGTTWKTYRSYSSKDDFNLITASIANSGENINKDCLIRINYYSHTSGTLSYDLMADTYENDGIVKIKTVTDTRHATATVISEIGATGATDNWAEGSWSDYRGWPSTVAFDSSDRLCFGGTKAEPNRIDMSQTGDYNNFGRSTPLADTDAVTYPLWSRKSNQIQTLSNLNTLVAITSGAEWLVGSASGDGVITPTSIKGTCQGSGGGSTVEPVIIGNRLLYVQPMGTVIKDMGYSLESDGFTSEDISVVASHLFKYHNVVQMAYQQEPDSIIWIVRDDGALIGLTYMKEQQIVAWHRHDTQGKFESVCTIPGESYDEVWFIVKRGNERFIEILSRRMWDPDDYATWYFMDCGITYNGEPANVITGLDHLEGKTVSVLADGNVLPNQTVKDGKITLSTAASIVHVGLGYYSDFESLKPDFQSGNGTVQSQRLKIPSAILRFQNSRGGWVGPNFDDMVELVYNSSGSPLGLYSEDIEQTISGGYRKDGGVCYRQKDPLPVTIMALMPKVTQGG